MSAERKTAAMKRSGPPAGPGRLINPAVRDYMDSLNLQRFYGGYQVVHLAEQVFNLGIGEVGNIPLPEELYDIYRRFLQERGEARMAIRYNGTLGERETNRLVARHLNRWLGEERFDEGRVVSLDGGQNAMEVAVRAFTAPLGSRASRKQYVLLAAPSYPYLSAVVSSQAGIMSFLAFDGEEFTRGVETYCNPAVGLILVNVPHNPMGYALSADQVGRINRVAEVYDCAILVDGVYGTYPEDAGVGHALAGFDPGRTVFADSFSKKYGLPGLRIGFALSAEEELTYAMRFLKTSESLTPNNDKLAFAGHLLASYPDYPALIAGTVRERRRRFLARFDPGALSGVTLAGARDNPFYLPLDISGLCARRGLPDAEVAEVCLERFQVKVFPGAWVFPSQALHHATFRGAGRHNPHGPAPYLPPQFPPGAPIVFAPDHIKGRKSLLRLSFGMETRPEAAAEALGAALASLA
jgi:valine--pyruvate aminotransferase